MTDIVIVGAKRTAIGSFLGQFTGVPTPQLGATAIRGAVLAQQPLGFTYSRPGAEPRRRSVAPCGVMFGRANYLVAADRETGRIQTFRLDRMSHVAPQEGVAAPPPDFDLSVFASQSFGIYQDEIEDVVLRISPEGAAGILWRDGARAKDAANAMKITAP